MIRIATAAALALVSGQAFAFDASKYTSPTYNTPLVDKLTIQGSGSTGDVSGMTAKAAGTPAARSFADRLSDRPMLKDFGAAAGGDWLNPFVASLNSPYKTISLPEGVYPVSFGIFGAAGKTYTGPGVIHYADGPKDAPWRTVETTFKPNPTGWTVSPTNTFTGDFSQMILAGRKHVTSGATPPVANTYTNMVMAGMVYLGMDFDGGFNRVPADHAQGRTGGQMMALNLRHNGQGDFGGISYNLALNSHLVGATHFLANPAVSMYGGNVYATPDGVGGYLQGSEVNFSDSGVSVAVIDRVRNYHRTALATNLAQIWIHDRPQSDSLPIDAFYNPGGYARRGLDMTTGSFGTEQAAVVLAPQQRIYFGGYAAPDSAGLTTVATSVGFAKMFMDSNGYIHIDSGPGKATIIDNIPNSAAGLPAGSVYGGSSGELKVAGQPAKPTFNATGLTASIAAGNEITGWIGKTVDANGNFNLTTGRFTTPVAGTFSCFASLISTTPSADAFAFIKNGAVQNTRAAYNGSTGTFAQLSAQMLIGLAANDYVSLKALGGVLGPGDPAATFGCYKVD